MSGERRLWTSAAVVAALALNVACTGSLEGGDAGAAIDAGVRVDGGASGDAGASMDAGASVDAGEAADAGTSTDAATAVDAGAGGNLVGPRVTDFTESGPIELSSGMTVTGLHVSNPSGPCIHGDHVTDVHIVDNMIGPCGAETDPNGVGIGLDDSSQVHVDHNSFDDVASALYITGYGGDVNDIVFDHNVSTRIRGPLPRGQMVQFNHVRGAGNAVLCNVDDETAPGYLAGQEDHVSVFDSAGTAASPLTISYNKLRGGGPSHSGGGILSGDYGSSYVDVTDNILINPGQYGLAVAGGDHGRFLRNRVYSPVAFEWSNIGMFVWNQSPTIPCTDNEMRDNRVFYVRADGPNNSWNAGNCGDVAGFDTDNVWGDDTLTDAMWDEVIAACE